ncbi:transcription factor kayak-like [Saccostrea cucullata]|uniref:transcription factor kayak-like n=1 Tax=Saccostrea cuccullata TaxID=36930 RepID=UPI002ED599CD
MLNTDFKMDMEMYEADPVFKKAREELSEHGVSPTLIKDVLKSKIQLRRVSAGQEELRVEDRPSLKHPLTEEEQEKNEARKKCNRVSAKRCREKKKQENQQIFDMLKDQEQRNEDLKQKISEMESEKSKMLKTLSEKYSQLNGYIITPENVMDIVNLGVQSGIEISETTSESTTANTPNDQNNQEHLDQSNQAIPATTPPNSVNNSGEMNFQTMFDFTTQTENDLGVQRSVNSTPLASREEQFETEDFLACIPEEHSVHCWGEWNDLCNEFSF